MLDEASRSARPLIHLAGRAEDAGREVVLMADIDALGRVERVAVARSSRLRALDQSALRAVAGWRYRWPDPLLSRAGVPVAVSRPDGPALYPRYYHFPEARRA